MLCVKRRCLGSSWNVTTGRPKIPTGRRFVAKNINDDTLVSTTIKIPGRGRKRSPATRKNEVSPSFSCTPVVFPQAAKSILHESSYTSVGGLFEAIQQLLLVYDSPIGNTLHRQYKVENHVPLSYTLNLNSTTIPRNNLRIITEPGEIQRRLTKLQWIGFLQQQVERTGPTGRYVSSQLNLYMPPWDTDPNTSPHHALKLDQETFIETVAEAVGLASNQGRDWSEDQFLLARSIYPGKQILHPILRNPVKSNLLKFV